MKQLDNQHEKSYIVKCRPQNNTIEGWSIKRLPFEPQGWLKDFRNDLRTAIHSLQSHPGQILHAIYATPQSGLCDIENILFYNVGTSHFASLMTNGLRFERSYSYPDPPYPLSTPHLHYHHYTMEDAHNDFSGWQTSKLVAAWENIEIPRSIRKITATNIWYRLRSHPLKIFQLPEHPLAQFGLCITVTVPDTTTITLAPLIKPIIDGVVSALHAYRGTEIEQISRHLGLELGQTPAMIANLLQQPDRAPLGERQVVRTYRNSVKWDPADELCLAAELFLQPYTGKDWLLSGKLYEIQYRLTFRSLIDRA